MVSEQFGLMNTRYLPVFFYDTYISTEVFVDFDKPPIFNEYVFEEISYKSNSYFMDCFYESHTSPTRITILKPKFDRHTRQKLSFPKFGGDFLTKWINNKVELPANLFEIYPC